MGEMEGQRELRGFGGWLVLFQIYIIMAVVGGLESTLLMILTETNTVTPFFEPFYMGLTSVIFGLSLACMILFYCKRMAFRTMFVTYFIVMLVSSVTYLLFRVPLSYAGASRLSEFLGAFINTLSIVFMVKGMASVVAFIVALYKSRRVNYTFIK